MGTLSKAPVFYVVAQVHHSPILKLDAFVPDLQDLLRKNGFPGYKASKLTQLTFQVDSSSESGVETKLLPKEITTHIFASRDGNTSLVISSDNFFLQTVEYTTIDAFIETFLKGINVIASVLSPDSFTRIGLRFLDAILPPRGGALADYLKSEFLGLVNILDDDWSTAHTYSETLLSRADQQCKVRVLTKRSVLTWPADLAPIAPTLPARFAAIDGIHGLLDTDSSYTTPPEATPGFSSDAIIDRIRKLKADIRDTFNAVVTKTAIEDWT